MEKVPILLLHSEENVVGIKKKKKTIYSIFLFLIDPNEQYCFFPVSSIEPCNPICPQTHDNSKQLSLEYQNSH